MRDKRMTEKLQTMTNVVFVEKFCSSTEKDKLTYAITLV